jgi:hypothetical protein
MSELTESHWVRIDTEAGGKQGVYVLDGQVAAGYHQAVLGGVVTAQLYCLDNEQPCILAEVEGRDGPFTDVDTVMTTLMNLVRPTPFGE